MDRMTVRNEAGLAVVNCDGCKSKDGYEMCHLLRCRNRLKDRLCELEDKIEGGELVERSESKRQTNADRIRAMSDEELAQMLNKAIVCHHLRELGYCHKCPLFGANPCDTEGVLEWLKQPAE